ncbi:M23 family metallopeptidase [Nocardia concava]|uniref:M23 family metallopeptidase n=1 Tax=Nocardia concava TaxID=257281 RepID=UPI0009FE48E3
MGARTKVATPVHTTIPTGFTRVLAAAPCVVGLAALCVVGLAAPSRGAPADQDVPVGAYGWPLVPRPAVVRVFDKPEHDWLPGHRGVDLAGVRGQAVLSAGDGIVVFAGLVAGKPVVSIDHPGGSRTTYEPVVASIAVGRRLTRGTPIGVLEEGHAPCSPCLHWGARRDREYVDPLGLLRRGPIRLKPLTSGPGAGSQRPGLSG